MLCVVGRIDDVTLERIDGGQLASAVQPKRSSLVSAGDEHAVGRIKSGQGAGHRLSRTRRELREQGGVDGLTDSGDAEVLSRRLRPRS